MMTYEVEEWDIVVEKKVEISQENAIKVLMLQKMEELFKFKVLKKS